MLKYQYAKLAMFLGRHAQDIRMSPTCAVGVCACFPSPSFFMALFSFQLDFPYFMVHWMCSCLKGEFVFAHWSESRRSLVSLFHSYIPPLVHTRPRDNLHLSMLTTFS